MASKLKKPLLPLHMQPGIQQKYQCNFDSINACYHQLFFGFQAETIHTYSEREYKALLMHDEKLFPDSVADYLGVFQYGSYWYQFLIYEKKTVASHRLTINFGNPLNVRNEHEAYLRIGISWADALSALLVSYLFTSDIKFEQACLANLHKIKKKEDILNSKLMVMSFYKN